MKTESIITLNKDEIFLKKNQNNFYDDFLEIINLTDSYIIYKIFVNVKGIYSTTPASSYIKPKDKIKVYIKREITTESLSNEQIKIQAYKESEVVDVSFFKLKDANFKNLFNKDKLKDYPAITLKVSLSSQLLQEHTKSVVKNVLNSLTDEVYNENIDSLIKVEEENL